MNHSIIVITFVWCLLITFGKSSIFEGILGNSKSSSTIGGLELLKKEIESVALTVDENGEPLFSQCYQNAIDRIEVGCQDLTSQDTRERMAIDLTNCHLEKSGIKTYQCTRSMSIKDCTKPMLKEKSDIFGIYTKFFTHVDEICNFLALDQYQRKIFESTSKLFDFINVMSNNFDELNESSKMVEKEIELIREVEEEINAKQDSIKNNLDDMYSEQKIRNKEIKDGLQTATDIISNLQYGIEVIQKITSDVTSSLGDFSSSTLNNFNDLKDRSNVIQSSLNEALYTVDDILEHQVRFVDGMKTLNSQHETLQMSSEEIKTVQHEVMIGQSEFFESQKQNFERIKNEFSNIRGIGQTLHKMLEESEIRQNEISEKQRVTLENLKGFNDEITKFIIGIESQLTEVVTSVEGSAKQIKVNAEKFATYFQKLFFDVEKLFVVYNSLLGEWISIETIGYYCVLIFLIYFLTSTKPTERVRIIMYMICIINIFIERYIVRKYNPMYDMEILRNKLGVVRKLMVVLLSISLTYSYMTFKDYDMLNNKILKENYQLLQELRKLKQNRNASHESDDDMNNYYTNARRTKVSSDDDDEKINQEEEIVIEETNGENDREELIEDDEEEEEESFAQVDPTQTQFFFGKNIFENQNNGGMRNSNEEIKDNDVTLEKKKDDDDDQLVGNEPEENFPIPRPVVIRKEKKNNDLPHHYDNFGEFHQTSTDSSPHVERRRRTRNDDDDDECQDPFCEKEENIVIDKEEDKKIGGKKRKRSNEQTNPNLQFRSELEETPTKIQKT